MDKHVILVCFLFISFMFSSCGTYKHPYLSEELRDKAIPSLPTTAIDHKLYLIGDAGGLNDKTAKVNYVIEQVKKRMDADTSEKSLVYLGDNVYNNGLGKASHPDRSYHEDILQTHLSVADDNDAKVYFIPGNHDWNHNKAGGLAAVKRQAEYVKKQADSKSKVAFYPENGCGDPKVVKVHKDLAFIFIDSQWWVSDWSQEPKINMGCKIQSRRAFLDKLKDLIIEHKNDQMILFTHHPMISNGSHGGHFSVRDHLFPLSRQAPSLLLPVPFLGSIYPVARQLGLSNQDNSHALLRELHEFLESTIRAYDASQVMMISGHDHFLQHSSVQDIFQKFPIHYVISGSGYKTSYAAKGQDAHFVYAQRGYGVLNFYIDGSTWMEFYEVDKEGMGEQLAYRKEIYTPKPGKKDFDFTSPALDTVTKVSKAPNPKFKKGKGFRLFLGDQYRKAWTTPVQTEVFHLDKFYGGLEPIKKGGGLFSRTLRLRDKTDKEYVLRSVNKDFFKAVPKNIQHLELLKLYSDQNTASVPYGALYISELSKYAEVYHTEPQLVYMQSPEELGPFQSYFPNGHYLLEERPDGDWSNSTLFGSSAEVIGYNDLLYNLRKKSTHLVDQCWTLKSRLFDILIHDRDRHDDQWRWAAFGKDGNTIYRPIPRDRDWAFFKYRGLVPGLIGNVVDKKLKSFKANSIDVISLATNAKNFDRYFLNELTWEDWQQEIDKLVTALTDEVIDEAIKALPLEGQEYLQTEIAEKLKSRRDILEQEVKKYYLFLSEEVEIIGTDEKDIFEIATFENGDTQVKVSRDSKKHGVVKRYERILKARETKELRIYGLAGDDDFVINHKNHGKTQIRIIGGEGEDRLAFSGAGAPKPRVAVYDTPKGMDINDLAFIRDYRDHELRTNHYDRRGFQNDTGIPWLYLGYSPDENLLLGMGFTFTQHGWRHRPFKSKHFLNFEIAPFRRDGYGLALNYEGEWTNVLWKRWSYNPELEIDAPNYINYFGPLNGVVKERDDQYNFVKRSSWIFQSNMTFRSRNNRIKFKIGPVYESHKLEPEAETILLLETNLPNYETTRSHFVGIQSSLNLHTLDRPNHPSSGYRVDAFAKQQYDLDRQANTLLAGGNISFFAPIVSDHKMIFGFNTGIEKRYGAALFYQLPSMGGKRFRPARSDRYRGEAIAYMQFDLRSKLFNWNNAVLPVSIGLITGYDVAQAFISDNDDGAIKHGWTFGASFDLLDYFVLRTSYSSGQDGKYFVLGTGFSF